ncbi:pheromone A receptor-domain-containing protein [Amylostereum chailletii]|nr:pheromone A receptor-domain-containing protein [Amylostereum chailletii]
MDPTYPLVPVVSLVSAFLVLLSLLSLSMRQSWNTGVWMLGVWLFLAGIINGVDTIVWADNVRDVAPVWCDIATHINVAAAIGIPACSLVITHRLYKIIHQRKLEASTRREVLCSYLFDFGIGFGFPLFLMSLYYIIQTTRYEIIEEYGCASTEVLSGFSYMIYDAWSIVLPLISALVYTPRILWYFFRHARETNAFLSTNASINRHRYLYIMIIGCIDIVTALPFGILKTSQIISLEKVYHDFPFWPGWDETHDGPPVIVQLAVNWRAGPGAFDVQSNKWKASPIAISFFLLFGLTREARGTYKRMFWAVVRPLGWKPTEPAAPELASMAFVSAGETPTRVSLSLMSSVVLDVDIEAFPREGRNPHDKIPSVSTIVEEEPEKGNHRPYGRGKLEESSVKVSENV